jgi:hypothetical protein
MNGFCNCLLNYSPGGRLDLKVIRANSQKTMFSANVAYPPNDISKTCLKMQAFYAYFMRYHLALNSYFHSYFRLR